MASSLEDRLENNEVYRFAKLITNKIKNKEIITFSLGIGNSEKVAENALKEAKKNKMNPYSVIVDLESNLDCGNECNDKGEENDKIRELFDYIKNNYGQDHKVKEFLTLITKDPLTNCYNPLGKMIFEEENSNKNTYYLFFDGNDMHELNKIHGYDYVSNLLSLSGKALSQNIRFNDSVVKMESYRQHGSAGDEFLVKIYSDNELSKEELKNIGLRLLTAIYITQVDSKERKNKKIMENWKSIYEIVNSSLNSSFYNN